MIYLTTPAADSSRRPVDFVLAWEVLPDEIEFKDRVTKRDAYLQALLEAGLECEEEEETGETTLKFMKLHVPLDIMKKYAEILKLRMALKASLEDKELENLAMWEKDAERKDLEMRKSENSHTSPQVELSYRMLFYVWLEDLGKVRGCPTNTVNRFFKVG